MAGDHASSVRAQGLPKREVLRSSAVGVDDIGGAQAELYRREARCQSALSQCAAGRANDRLPVTPYAQSMRQRQQRFLAAAPGFFRVYVDDRKRSQKNECSTSQPA